MAISYVLLGCPHLLKTYRSSLLLAHYTTPQTHWLRTIFLHLQFAILLQFEKFLSAQKEPEFGLNEDVVW
jgi:hypothetical protein